MGLTVDIYMNPAFKDCSNGGVSSRVRQLTLVNVDGPSEPTPERPAARLVRGAHPGIAVVRPVLDFPSLKKPVGPMMGGAYVASSDSRFSKAVQAITGHPFYGAVPLHDRYETQDEYDRNFD